MHIIRKHHRAIVVATGGILLLCGLPGQSQTFQQVNLVTDNSSIYPAASQDPNLVNAWGVSYGPTSPFWVSANGSGSSTLYQVNPLTDTPTTLGLVVKIPGAGNPTGQAFNPLAASGAFNGNLFLFASEDGTISGWRNSLGTSAEVLATGSPDNVYKGMAVGTSANHGYLYAANFRSGAIDVFKGDPAAPNLAAHFVDPNLPSGYAPFNIRNLGGTLLVTYALQDNSRLDDVAGAGHGFVDAYDLQGNLMGRVATQGTLNSPWGLELAPASFGPFAGDLLVGNFGDGTISAFDLNSLAFKGQLPGAGGSPLAIDGLWALTVGNNGNAGSSDKLYFSSGPDGESHGVFGIVTPTVPDGGSGMFLLMMSLCGLRLASGVMRR